MKKNNNTMTITKHTANRISRYCDAITSGFTSPVIPTSPYTFDELKGETAAHKANHYKEVKFAVGKDVPTRKDIRTYNKVYESYGNTHSRRMDKILEIKLQLLALGA